MNDMNTPKPQTEAPHAVSKPSEFWTVFLLSLLLGIFGIHRFYARKFKTAIVQLLTCGGFGIWSFIDTIIILLGKFTNANGVVYRNPKPKVTWGVFAVVVILGFASAAGDKGNEGSGGSGSHSSYGGSSHNKSARHLIEDYAHSHYGKIESIDIDNYTDGSYQVRIYSSAGYRDMGYKSATYKVSVDESAQAVTSWEYVGE